MTGYNSEIYLPPETHQDQVEEFYRLKRGSVPSFGEAWRYLKEEIGEVEEEVEERTEWTWESMPLALIDLKHLAKELADVKFTLYGVAIAAGIDLDKAFQLVVDSNRTKERTPEGKVQKGENYQEPDMSEALIG